MCEHGTFAQGRTVANWPTTQPLDVATISGYDTRMRVQRGGVVSSLTTRRMRVVLRDSLLLIAACLLPPAGTAGEVNAQLNGTTWIIELTPTDHEPRQGSGPQKDTLHFDQDAVSSSSLATEGYGPASFTIS